MSWIGVITGDIVNSSKILEAGQRDKLLQIMYQTIEDLKQSFEEPHIRIDIFRGDSFQILTKEAFQSIVFAVMFRACLIANSTKEIRWDARLGIGIGEGEYLVDRVSESDGEAFHLSGKAFDNLGKGQSMSVLTPDKDFNLELKVSTAFADDIISNWTSAQANIFYQLRMNSNITQKQLATTMDITPQAISKLRITSKEHLMEHYLMRIISKTAFLMAQKNNQP